MNQSWYAQGVTLGQLLHSTSLAPGESTRVAVIDWSRKSRAGETEVISETDDLTNDATHNRSISEVTEAVANEAQSGFWSRTAKANRHRMGHRLLLNYPRRLAVYSADRAGPWGRPAALEPRKPKRTAIQPPSVIGISAAR